MSTPDAIDLLEKRLAALEVQVLPEKEAYLLFIPGVVDLLIEAQTMIKTALSCRDVMSSIVEKLPLINAFLDPMHCENELELQTRRQYILEMTPELMQSASLLTRLEMVKCFTDSKSITRIADLSEKLESVAVSSFTHYTGHKLLTEDVVNYVQMYNEVIKTIKELFAQFEFNLTEIEKALAPKPPVDD